MNSLNPHTPPSSPGFHDGIIAELTRLHRLGRVARGDDYLSVFDRIADLQDSALLLPANDLAGAVLVLGLVITDLDAFVLEDKRQDTLVRALRTVFDVLVDGHDVSSLRQPLHWLFTNRVEH